MAPLAHTVPNAWRVDRLALGQHLGAPLQDTFRYHAQRNARTMYILGDPTLRAYVTSPPPGLTATVRPNCGSGLRNVTLTWTAPVEAVDGYYVYRGSSLQEALSSPPLAGPSASTPFLDCVPTGPTYWYAVRAVKLATTGAGSFRNLSSATCISIPVTP